MIPGFIISALTFPGVIVHELAHQLFCRLCNVAVFDVCYFQFENPAGYVVHEKPKYSYQNILIGVGPFLINTLIGMLITFPVSLQVIELKISFLQSPFSYILMWLGISILMHAFPSTGDAKNMWKSIKDEETSIVTKIIGAPIVMLIYVGAIGSVAWLDLLYAIAVSTFIPDIIISCLA